MAARPRVYKLGACGNLFQGKLDYPLFSFKGCGDIGKIVAKAVLALAAWATRQHLELVLYIVILLKEPR